MEKGCNTIKYYNENAIDYFVSTVNADMSDARKRFTSQLPEHGKVLDFGCGSGRDAKAFLQQGYLVDAIDGSEALCKKAEQLLGKPVKCCDFRNFEEENVYDGIWACASILHLPEQVLKGVITRITRALKSEGAAYLSFKYGDFEGIRNGRYFTDMTEQRLLELLPADVSVIEEWISDDVRPDRETEKWLNAIVKKV